MKIVRILALFLASSAAVALGGCYADVEPQPTYVTAGEVDGYVPAYYDGYVVYYDDTGRPYYYGPNGVVVWVSPSSPHYYGLVQHWRVYGRAYPHWYANYGYRYRSYRGAPGYHAYRGYHGSGSYGGGGYRGGGAAHAPPAHRR